MAIVVLPTSAQITFKLKSVVGQQNPSSNGLFSYGTLNNGTFQLFPHYGEDGTGDINGISQKGWTFVLGQENYPFLAFEQLNAGEVTPQPFPPFGIFMHPSNDAPSVVKLSIPNNATIISITNNVQRPSFGCGENIGYSIITDNSTILPRTIISTSNSPNTYTVGTTFINAGNNIYFVVDKGDDGNYSCDDTAIDVEITLVYEKIVTPILSGTFNCNATNATFDIAFQQSGTLELYKLGNPNPISTTNISQVGNTFNGQGTFSGLDLSTGGDFYVIAKNTGQTQSDQSAIISVTPCCSNAVAPSISVNNLSLCQGNIGILTATGCTNGTVTWSNGFVGTSTTVNVAGTYTATCKVLATSPCSDATSTASGVVTINSLPTLSVGATTCNADLLTYSVLFASNGVVISSAGTVSGNTIINIPTGLDVTLTATSNTGCAVTKTVSSPNCTCPKVNAPISGGNQTICQGQTIPALTVNVGANETGDWYNASGTLVASSTLSYTPTVAQYPLGQYPLGETFYVQAKNTTTNCVSATRTAISLTINALPTLNIGIRACSPNLLTYSVSFTSDGVVTSSVGTVSAAAAAAGIVSGIPTGTNVILTATSSTGCVVTQTISSPNCSCPTVNVPVSGGNQTICQGQTIPSLTANVETGETVEWYDAPSGGNLLTTGSSYTPSIATGGIFYAQAKNKTTNCVSTTRSAISLTINALPTLNVGTTACSANLLTYSVSYTSDGVVTSSAGTVSAAAAAAGIVLGIPTGSNITLTATGSTGCVITQMVSSPNCSCPTVNAPVSGGNQTICQGQTIPSLTASVETDEIVEWYDAPSGGNLLTTGSSYTPSIATGGIFYAQAKNVTTNCVSAARTAISLTINVLPTLNIGTRACSANLLTYSASYTSDGVVTSSAGMVSAAAAAAGIVSGIPTGTNVILTATSNAGCVVTQTISSPTCTCPLVNAPVSGGNQIICLGQTIPFLTVNVGNGEVVEWYDALSGGNLLATGSNYTPSVANGGIFYAQAKNITTNCVSATRTAVALTVNTLPTIAEGTKTCSPDLLTYSVSFTSDATTITSTAGIVSGTTVQDIPKGMNVEITAISSTGCQNKINVTAPSCVCPTVISPISGGDKTICQKEAIPTLSVTVGTGEVIDWYDAPTGGTLLLANSTTYIPSMGQSPLGAIFYAETKNTTNNCVSNTRTAVKLTINPIGATPTIIASKNPITLGETAVLSVSNCNGIITWNTGESTKSISVTPPTTTEYSATCTANGGCIGGNGKITVNVSVPKIEVKASPNIVCIGGSTTLSMIGCPTNDIYWTSPEYGRRNEIAPLYNGIVQAGSFTGHCITSAGESTTTIGIEIRQPQDFKIVASKNPIYLGESTILSVDGCDGIVSWQNGQATGNPLTVWPTNQYTDYVAECLSPNACGGKGKITIEVKPPIITAIGKDVCWGSTASLSQTGCSTAFYWVVWKKDDFSDAQAIDNPNAYPITEPTRFRVACSTTAGEGAGDILIRPIPLPNKPKITPNKESYFTGETVELNVLNCNGHLVWSNGEEGSIQIRVKPVRTSTYTATCKGGYDCISQSSIEVIVKTPTPKVKDLTICYGDTLVLNSGCPKNAGLWTDNWRPSLRLDIPNRTIRKESEKIRMFTSNTYGVSCEGEAGLSDMVAFTVTVKPKIDAPTIQSEKSVIIKGDSLELLANGCIETEWTDNKSLLFGEKTNKIVVKPIFTTIFSARCLVDGCYSNYGSFKVLVRPKKPQIVATLDTLCVGSFTTIIAQNCEDDGILKWLHNNNNADSFSVSPQMDTTYKAVCIGLDSLVSDTTAVKIKVYPIPKAPTITVSSLIIIEDERTILTASNCEGIITWNTGKIGSSLTVSPTKNTTYSATCTIWRCVSEKAEITIKVRPKQLEITDGNETNYFLNDTLCLQKQLTLSVVTSCNGTIIWSNGQRGRSITIVGTKNEVYEVFCQNADNEKSDISTATVLVKDYNITDAYIYPNPTSGKLFIQSKGCIDGIMLRLYTLRGELIYEGGGHERYLDSLVLDLFNLPSEEYVLHIIGTDGTKPVTLRKRVVKTNKE